jgi:hypothetical protein
MAMRMTTVRFSESLWRDLQKAADDGGISVAQYVREAAIAWMNWERGVEYGRAEAAKNADQAGEQE